MRVRHSKALVTPIALLLFSLSLASAAPGMARSTFILFSSMQGFWLVLILLAFQQDEGALRALIKPGTLPSRAQWLRWLMTSALLFMAAKASILSILVWTLRGSLQAGRDLLWIVGPPSFESTSEVLIFSVAFVAPLEEMVYRGALLQWMLTVAAAGRAPTVSRVAGALFISSAIYVGLHEPTVFGIEHFAGGLIFGLAFIVTRSLAVPISLHMVWNAADVAGRALAIHLAGDRPWPSGIISMLELAAPFVGPITVGTASAWLLLAYVIWRQVRPR